jgi:GGDEF domain-containing protein
VSGVFDLDTDGSRALEEEARLNPFNPKDLPPPLFAGTGEALKGLMRPSAAAGRTLMTIGALDPIAKDAAVSLFTGERTTVMQDAYFRDVVDDVGNSAVDYWTANPETMGSAAKALNVGTNVIGTIPQMIGAPGLFLANAGIDPAIELQRQGVDTKTSLAVGAINLGVNAVGLRLPAAFGNTLATKVATGAGSNLVLGAGADAASSGVLDAGGYEQQAQGYNAADPYARGLDILLGAAFGVRAHVDAAPVPPAQRDAVLTVNNNDHARRRTMPGEPVSPAAATVHANALSVAIGQALRGEAVNVASMINPADFVLRPEVIDPGVSTRALAGGSDAKSVQADFRAIAEQHGATITSMVRPVIARGAGERSQHPHGTAADFRTRDKTPEQVDALMSDLRKAGFEVVDERNTDQPHIHAELPPGGRRAAETPEGTAGEVVREAFADPDQVAVTRFAETARKFDVSEDVAVQLAPRAPRDSVTGYFDGRQDTAKTDLLDRAIAHVERTREPAQYVSADLYNLGGLNAHVGNRAEEANVHFRAMAEILESELRGTGADVVAMRTGGDELGLLAVNADGAKVADAIARANERVQLYAREQGLSEIPHPKRSGEKGVGLHVGVASIDPGRSVRAILDRADDGVNLSKLKATPDVPREATLPPGAQPPRGQSGSAPGRDRAPDSGVRPAAIARGRDEGSAAGSAAGEVGAAETPLQAAQRSANESPDTPVLDGFDADGAPRYRPMSEVLAEIEAEHQQAVNDARAFPAAVNCVLRRGFDAA